MYTFLTRPFTCRAIARPFARLAIASFYVYGLILCLLISLISIFTLLACLSYTFTSVDTNIGK